MSEKVFHEIWPGKIDLSLLNKLVRTQGSFTRWKHHNPSINSQFTPDAMK